LGIAISPHRKSEEWYDALAAVVRLQVAHDSDFTVQESNVALLLHSAELWMNGEFIRVRFVSGPERIPEVWAILRTSRPMRVADHQFCATSSATSTVWLGVPPEADAVSIRV